MTATVLERLRETGLIRRQRKGNAFWYQPRIVREALERARTRRISAPLLCPTPREAVAALPEAVDSLDPHRLERFERAVAARGRVRNQT